MCDWAEEWEGPIVDRDKKSYKVCAGGCPYPVDKDGVPKHKHFNKCPACGGKTRNMTMDDVRSHLFKLIRLTPHLDWQLLTKRADRVASCLPTDWGPTGWPNVWLGVSAEDQKWADKRLPMLRDVPAMLRFVSYEPALGPIDFNKVVKGAPLLENLGWVIYGGESGPDFRPHLLDWARVAREQCEAAGIPFFYKQGAGKKSGLDPELDGKKEYNFPVPRPFPKSAA
jgi:protein gp37